MAVTSLPALGLGCARVGSFNNPSPLSESIALIRAAMALGVTLLDTANIYGQGDSERAIGKAVAGVRDEAFIVTKGGLTFSAKMKLLRPLKPLLRPFLARGEMDNAVTASRAAVMRSDWSADALVASLDGSLKRLRTDRVDAFLLHSPSAEMLGQAGPAEALSRIAASGRAAMVGVACDDIASLDAALALDGVSILELPLDVLAGIADGPRAAAIATRNIAVIAREVLKFQPGIPPARAVANARAMPIVSSTLIGSRRIDRVRALALAEAGA
ncbi:aldo/keto reductase [Sphingomonas sp.]|uniref:aldo/keto reductase n=1 Tax=Sphingomonas sp. TaxID=28214 RepID=UPI0025EF4EB6|nr:aldo/keto reductase [Sphingomonas sp.]